MKDEGIPPPPSQPVPSVAAAAPPPSLIPPLPSSANSTATNGDLHHHHHLNQNNHNGHTNSHNSTTNHNSNSNANNSVQHNDTQCHGCQQLKRELDIAKTMISQLIAQHPNPTEFQNVLSLLRIPMPQLPTRPAAQPSVQSQTAQPTVADYQAPLFAQVASGAQNMLPPWAHLLLPGQFSNGLPALPAGIPTSSAWPNVTGQTNGIADQARVAATMEHNTVTPFIDPISLDNSEASSSASSANTQHHLMISPHQRPQPHPTLFNGNAQTTLAEQLSNAAAAAVAMSRPNMQLTNPALVFQQLRQAMLQSHLQTPQAGALAPHPSVTLAAALQTGLQLPLAQPHVVQAGMMGSLGHANHVDRPTTSGGGPDRRKASTDDYIKFIRQRDLSDEAMEKIKIPVPEALSIDPNFRPHSEQQIIQQIQQSKKYDANGVSEAMVQLCKKLAEKRVFGPKLMADTTVAAPNHSTYQNLPENGILYIFWVCKKVFGHRFKSEEDLWNQFREAMKKLAARCRRVRHARKARSNANNHITLMPSNDHTIPPPQALIQGHPFTPMSTNTQASTPTPTSSMASILSVTNGNGTASHISNGETNGEVKEEQMDEIEVVKTETTHG